MFKCHYQAVKRLSPHGEECFQICEKYIQDARYGPYELTEEAVKPLGGSLDALRSNLIQMLADLEEHGVIDRTNIINMTQK